MVTAAAAHAAGARAAIHRTRVRQAAGERESPVHRAGEGQQRAAPGERAALRQLARGVPGQEAHPGEPQQ